LTAGCGGHHGDGDDRQGDDVRVWFPSSRIHGASSAPRIISQLAILAATDS